ncbi:phospholipase B1, membrane-associated-like [Onthophagus taurus]|uniref:phospholipase B1, membrane-associated-like n=1 Tax=Onthophagus taurus TaxID=166361 RepID=UPI000C1FE5F5|nr:phospholipase B1, membrane-associated-like [Onthophagus taurus]XP_022919289.1 phospholipase B1, membrane-associated-like [Onthophagus taurus]XP_022919290.1 phospholipase B1, membrane-associated-like [Onthophagus taurus]
MRSSILKFSLIGFIFKETFCQNPTFLDTILLEPFHQLRRSVMNLEIRDENKHRYQRQILEPFPCSLKNARSKHIPKSVHKLRPGDIDIIGALGDSITAGFGITATNLLNLVAENRGMVYSIGGQENWRKILTLPNILKLYNPNLFGYSLGPSLSIDRASQFNPAENGAVSDNLPYMAKVLIKRIKKDPRTDLQNHWKFISIMIGANDFCSSICFYKNPENAVQKHQEDLLISLRLLRDNLPKTFVSVITPPDVSQLANFTNSPSQCELTQRIFCPCFVGVRFKNRKDEFQKLIKKFQKIGEKLAGYDEFNRDDFTVVVQPLFEESKIPIGSDGFTDRDYFSVDCFHFSQITHSEAAKALWNNILEPINKKNPNFLARSLRCPTEEHPFLATSRNS